MSEYQLSVNDQQQNINVPSDTPLLWVLRDTLGLRGTKLGCGICACGACTVHVNGAATRSCITTVASVANQRITTIEGLRVAGTLHPLQAAWIDEDVPQCGYCQSGQIMTAAALLATKPTRRKKKFCRRSLATYVDAALIYALGTPLAAVCSDCSVSNGRQFGFVR
jgi:isoquinoline 1-oxidoreductase alpha subunit